MTIINTNQNINHVDYATENKIASQYTGFSQLKGHKSFNSIQSSTSQGCASGTCDSLSRLKLDQTEVYDRILDVVNSFDNIKNGNYLGL